MAGEFEHLSFDMVTILKTFAVFEQIRLSSLISQSASVYRSLVIILTMYTDVVDIGRVEFYVFDCQLVQYAPNWYSPNADLRGEMTSSRIQVVKYVEIVKLENAG